LPSFRDVILLSIIMLSAIIGWYHYAECYYCMIPLCWVPLLGDGIMLSAIIAWYKSWVPLFGDVIMLSVIMLSVILLNTIIGWCHYAEWHYLVMSLCWVAFLGKGSMSLRSMIYYTKNFWKQLLITVNPTSADENLLSSIRCYCYTTFLSLILKLNSETTASNFCHQMAACVRLCLFILCGK